MGVGTAGKMLHAGWCWQARCERGLRSDTGGGSALALACVPSPCAWAGCPEPVLRRVLRHAEAGMGWDGVENAQCIQERFTVDSACVPYRGFQVILA